MSSTARASLASNKYKPITRTKPQKTVTEQEYLKMKKPQKLESSFSSSKADSDFRSKRKDFKLKA